MEHITRPTVPSVTLLARFMSWMRRLQRACRLNKVFHIIRRGIHFGPWRVVAKATIRAFRPIRACKPCEESLLRPLEPKLVAAKLRRDSFVIAGNLPRCFVAELRNTTDRLPVNDYKLVHEIDERIRRIAEDPGILDVLRAYFGCEPELLESTLLITRAASQRHLQRDKGFHVDYGGWESLNVMVYLTDVDKESSCHLVIRGSHRKMRYLDAVRGRISTQEANRRFGSDITEITGSAGLVFFENTEAFHERRPGNSRRVMLNLLYASHRAWFSHGRASPKHLKERARIFELAREVAPS